MNHVASGLMTFGFGSALKSGTIGPFIPLLFLHRVVCVCVYTLNPPAASRCWPDSAQRRGGNERAGRSSCVDSEAALAWPPHLLSIASHGACLLVAEESSLPVHWCLEVLPGRQTPSHALASHQVRAVCPGAILCRFPLSLLFETDDDGTKFEPPNMPSSNIRTTRQRRESSGRSGCLQLGFPRGEQDVQMGGRAPR
ncbi:uncharacterized protein LY79DRAFT_210948 [Colletotrichum navitas]|uniref:Uncharacterized protein n=1 Tax=Colletotrichum navitas TaxID=681940 RepID=A0AAD8QAS6_9PEZI|nr:uncharacterized protein LY79DRAFT_210948 [Colletotrichum navitas]KAK1599161.1 hypothetical protein LY79DRAFT_210948 [Colletotrichum navitas]